MSFASQSTYNMDFREKYVKWLFDQYVGVMLSITSRYPIGTNVFERDWDTLVLLDTCRVDAIAEVADEFDFLPPSEKVPAITSIGSGSYTWMANTFVEEYADEISETVYVSANMYSEWVLEEGWRPEEERGIANCDWKTLDSEDLLTLDQPWRHGEDVISHPDPAYVTKRAIGHARTYNPDRMIVHYSQPHEPYIANALNEGRGEEGLYEYEQNPWDHLRNYDDLETVWECYIEDLRMVLRHVQNLLNNHDAEHVIISADHGEAFGEFGVYRHPVGVLHPEIRKVPWVSTTAVDMEQLAGSTESRGRTADVESSLEDLGYL